jgi:hypothetical protein
MKKILYLILDHHGCRALSKACQNTWMRDIRENFNLIFLGDPLMPDNINGFEVYKPLPDERKENQDRITEKIVKAYNYIV